MSHDAQERCSNCGGPSVASELTFTKEIRRPFDAWVSSGAPERRPLCGDCYEWVEGLMALVTGGEGHAPLGTPFSATRSRVLDGKRCDYCQVWMTSPSYTASLVPYERELVRRASSRPSLLRHVGQLRSNRICSQCYLWWRSTLDDNSTMKGTGYREGEGTVGGWLGTVAYDACSVYLDRRDEDTLRLTVEAMGFDYAPITIGDVRRLVNPSQVVFVGASPDGHASELVSSRARALIRSTVVVARSDSASDVQSAVMAGVGDFLISPLTPQQVSGAFDRISDPAWAAHRHKENGLAVIAKPEARHGLPCHRIRAEASKEFEFWTACLLLRRAVRGYDRVGVDEKGNLCLLVYCPQEHLERTMSRLSRVFTGLMRLTALDSDLAVPAATVRSAA
jgi:hypothetical protein